jgi:dienelactone hydrolase
MHTLIASLTLFAVATVDLLGAQERPKIESASDTVLVDESLRIRVSGLRPGEEATMRLTLTAPNAGWETGVWSSAATYRADAAGRIDLATAAAVSGSYTAVSPMGLVWGAVRDTAQKDFAPGPERVDLTIETADRTAATKTFWRRRAALGVRVSTVTDSGLVASLHLPARPGRHPALVILGGSECGKRSAEQRADLLASYGYAALALAYCAWPDKDGRTPAGMDRLPRGVFEVPVEYVETALRWLAAHPEVDPGRIGLWGTSKGAELALLVAVDNTMLRAVVAVVPSSVAWPGLTTPWRSGPSWTRGGMPIPFVPFSRDSALMRLLSHPRNPTLAHMYLASLQDGAAVGRAAIPVERITAPLFLVSGTDDTLWPSAVMADMILGRLRERGSSLPVVHVRNENAGHAIAPPYYPTTEVATRLGGTPLGNAVAQEHSWRQALEFLERHLKRERK